MHIGLYFFECHRMVSTRSQHVVTWTHRPPLESPARPPQRDRPPQFAPGLSWGGTWVTKYIDPNQAARLMSIQEKATDNHAFDDEQTSQQKEPPL